MKSTYSLISYLCCCLFLFGAGFWFYPKWKKERTEATLSWDVSGYYLYLPATFIYQDLKKVSFLEKIIEDYNSVPNTEQSVFLHHSGNRVLRYSMGQAVLYSPFFFAAHLYALNSDYPPDGYSPPYQLGIQLGSLLVAFLGLFVMRKNLLRLFSDKAVALALILLVLATNYLEYAAITNAMTHNYLFTIYALLIAASIRFYEKPGWWMAAGIGVLIGLAGLTRPTDLIAALIPLGWGIYSVADLKNRLSFIGQHLAKYVLAIFLCIFIGSWQLLYWKYVGDEWIIYSYQDQGFSWLKPHLSNGLFSYRAGWLIYTPVMLLALIGFYPLFKKQFKSFWVLLIFSLIFIYITFSWDIWWYGGSLGQRVMVQLYPVLLFPLTALWEFIFRQKKGWLITMALFCGLCIYFNLWLHYQAHGGGLYRAGNMTKAYFLRVVGRFEKNKEDDKLLDVKEDYRGVRKNSRVIYQNDFEQDSSAIGCPHPTLQGERSLWLDPKRERTPVYRVKLPNYVEGSWVSISATFFCPAKKSDVWRMPHFIVSLKKNGVVIKEQYIKPFRLMEGGEKKIISFDNSLPGENEADTVEISFWRGYGQSVMIIDELEVELFEEG